MRREPGRAARTDAVLYRRARPSRSQDNTRGPTRGSRTSCCEGPGTDDTWSSSSSNQYASHGQKPPTGQKSSWQRNRNRATRAATASATSSETVQPQTPVQGTPQAWLCVPPGIRSDWDRFQKLATRGLAAGPETGIPDVENALSLVRGKPSEGHEYHEPSPSSRRSLPELSTSPALSPPGSPKTTIPTWTRPGTQPFVA